MICGMEVITYRKKEICRWMLAISFFTIHYSPYFSLVRLVSQHQDSTNLPNRIV
ncbi:hypothetical protein IJ22_48180 [Paenibacillus naphthalenovorans]|uniref:Uncharacterized protein n=1 Tax=Paenibacillus naphthalenovorans TaxID=162209 RepID=A0A0U2UG78_9BACL|nr:hypothetical protein IJ22_48180 [Paenibacillus naphthalenovorans]